MLIVLTNFTVNCYTLIKLSPMKIWSLMLITALFALINTAHAQIFKGGVLLGFNGCQIDGDSQSGYDKFGIMGGAFIYTPLSSQFDLQLEIEYMGKGAQSVSTPDNEYQEEFTISLNYIELPVLLRFNTIK